MGPAFTKENICDIARHGVIGKEIIFLDSVTSTNDVAIKTGMEREDPEGIVVVADSQSRGKGRFGRTWISPPGANLYFTVLLRPPFPPNEAAILTLMPAVAAVKAIRSYPGLHAEIKWPNDILINGKKAGGVLPEMRSAGNLIHLLAIGIGVNVNMPLSELPEDIRQISTSLINEKGESVDRLKLFGMMLAGLDEIYKIILTGDKRALINEWIWLNCTLGHVVSARKGDTVISGIAEDITDHGELIIRYKEGNVEVLNAGEVTILK